MTDREILQEVYRRVVLIARNGDANVPSQVRFKEFKNFIEREWQQHDEATGFDLSESYSVDASEIERHRGLEIGDDGTVKELK